ncbi:MAG: CvpA family protein [Candidatus Omnitrophica bacterium]|nr:CvpA family protein [Candidatus Omnitrophota bacterium]
MKLSFLPETNWVDIIIVIFLIRGGYIGLIQGFSVELFKTLGAIAATVVSLLYYVRVGGWLAAHSFLSPQAAKIIIFLIFFFLLLFVFRLIRVLLFKVLHLELLNSNLEKWVGLVLGLGRAVIFASFFVIALTLIPVNYLNKSAEEKSFSGPYLKEVAPRVMKFIVMFKPDSEKNYEEK